LSDELVDQIRFRTREGMKTAVKKGKASTCLAYGYKLSQQRDANGDRIRGLRDVDPVKGEIVRRIFKMYADGISPRDIAHILNNEGIIGPRGAAWRDTAIRAPKRLEPASSTIRATLVASSGTSGSTGKIPTRSGARLG
jgi:DNA invertase Pin-like site-specific DNA recombinase